MLLGVQNTCWVFTDEGPVEVWAKDGSQMLQTITGTPHPLCACVCAGKVWCGNRNGELEVFSISGDRLIFEQQVFTHSWTPCIFYCKDFIGSQKLNLGLC